MRHQTPRPRRSRAAQILSTILFIAAIGFGAAAAWIWYFEDDNDGPGPPPTADNAGEIELAHVLGVLKESDENWDYGRSPATAHTDQLPMPGQHLKLGDTSLFVFIFTGASGEERIAAREEAGEEVELESMEIKRSSSGEVISGGQPLHMTQHSSVITILVGGDDETADQVAEAITKLP